MPKTTIYKYPIEVADTQTLAMPAEADILCCQLQNGVACLWARVDPTQRPMDRTFRVFGTGHSIPDEPLEYIDTFLMPGLVFHVFEVCGFTGADVDRAVQGTIAEMGIGGRK